MSLYSLLSVFFYSLLSVYLLSPEVLEFAEIPVFVSGEYDVGQDGR